MLLETQRLSSLTPKFLISSANLSHALQIQTHYCLLNVGIGTWNKYPEFNTAEPKNSNHHTSPSIPMAHFSKCKTFVHSEQKSGNHFTSFLSHPTFGRFYSQNKNQLDQATVTCFLIMATSTWSAGHPQFHSCPLIVWSPHSSQKDLCKTSISYYPTAQTINSFTCHLE